MKMSKLAWVQTIDNGHLLQDRPKEINNSVETFLNQGNQVT